MIKHTIESKFGVKKELLENILEDFVEHLEASGISFVDVSERHRYSEAFILENYLGTFR